MGMSLGREGRNSRQKVKLRFNHFPKNLKVFCPNPVNWPVHITPRPPSAVTSSGPKESQAEQVPSKLHLEFANLGQPFPSTWPSTQVGPGLGFQSGSFKAVFYSPLSRGLQKLWEICCPKLIQGTDHKGGIGHMLGRSCLKWSLQKSDGQVLCSHVAAQKWSDDTQEWPLSSSVALSTARQETRTIAG